MNARACQPGEWSRQRWVTLVILVFGAHLFLVFWWGSWIGTENRPGPGHHPRIYLPVAQNLDLPGVANPTLFVLASRRGFSGPAWLDVPGVDYETASWRENPRPLLQPDAELGAPLEAFVSANYSRPFEVVDPPEPRWSFSEFYPPVDQSTNFPTVTIEGDLAGRRLLTELKPSAWPASDILTDTAVQIAVDAGGSVFDAVVLPPASGFTPVTSKDADANALALAKSARFAPLPGAAEISSPAGGRLTWGRLVFHWVTIPMRPAGGPAAARNP